MTEMVTISKEEYERLKALDKNDQELVESFKRGLSDLKNNRYEVV
jgi:hypothetical protein